ncbi:hypothetical protein SAMN05660209_00073 [Geodermatophilus africanus]|uniref:Uncharacterized protein n=1 Tax=Geodermatophilus africanus TaxID=1137993 RepID=A0A1H3AJG7_9ACTN|nr:hypothetical protein SAMN05660209_00073 [Geodermatophilus africanus]
MSVRESPDGSGPADLPVRSPLGRAVDRPAFWWSAAAIFFANAWFSAAEGRWALVVLQALTSLWAVVAGVTAQHAPSHSRESTGTSRR